MRFGNLARHAAWIAIAACLAGCAALSGPRVIVLTEADLTRLVERHAPKDRRLLEVLDVHISTPHVALLPESNRLATDLSVSTTERISGRSYEGRIALDYALRYEERDQSVHLTQVRVNRFELDAVPGPSQRGFSRLGALIAQQMLDEIALYHFTPSDLKSAEGHGLRPGAVTVTSRGVEITLVPLR